MLVLSRSRGDRNRALDIANDAERDLREGHEVLSNLVKEDTSKIYNGDPWSGTNGRWSDRVFTRSNWETSYNLSVAGNATAAQQGRIARRALTPHRVTQLSSEKVVTLADEHKALSRNCYSKRS